jgi:hypothetical protein
MKKNIPAVTGQKKTIDTAVNIVELIKRDNPEAGKASLDIARILWLDGVASSLTAGIVDLGESHL